ncbi:hypothetical protein NQ317_002043 [Molorchus minor]|uniref:Uncharacterized protein n=1 Tax=Molorchus minor TaxID=1323400 RepID=A0ABQ9JJT6_9CUCU|nr:hypothetical protein NQ317_002043 [Molorchus minor]
MREGCVRLTRRSDPNYKTYNEVEEASFPWLAITKAKRLVCGLEETLIEGLDLRLPTNVVNHQGVHGKNTQNTVQQINVTLLTFNC